MTIGTNTVSAIYIGTNEVLRITDGQGRVLYESVVPPAPTDDTPYMTFTATAANTLIRATHNGTNQTTTKPVFYKSTDKVNWEQWDTDMYIRLTSIGDKVYLYGENPNGIGRSSANYTNINLAGGAAEISGDITTLLTRYGNVSIPAYGFYKLFFNVQYTGTAEFGHQGCGNLSVGANGCASMFEEGRLTSADMHYITSLANTACNSMFMRDSTFNYMYAPSVDDFNVNLTTNNWLSGVAVTGTFKIDTYATLYRATYSVPNGWTVIQPKKTVTLSAAGPNDYSFKYRTGAQYTTLQQGSQVTLSIGNFEYIWCQTDGPEYQLEVNGGSWPWSETYTFTYGSIRQGDVITCAYQQLATKSITISNNSTQTVSWNTTAYNGSVGAGQSSSVTMYDTVDSYLSVGAMDVKIEFDGVETTDNAMYNYNELYDGAMINVSDYTSSKTLNIYNYDMNADDVSWSVSDGTYGTVYSESGGIATVPNGHLIDISVNRQCNHLSYNGTDYGQYMTLNFNDFNDGDTVENRNYCNDIINLTLEAPNGSGMCYDVMCIHSNQQHQSNGCFNDDYRLIQLYDGDMLNVSVDDPSMWHIFFNGTDYGANHSFSFSDLNDGDTITLVNA